jgi:hypothetical protein
VFGIYTALVGEYKQVSQKSEVHTSAVEIESHLGLRDPEEGGNTTL